MATSNIEHLSNENGPDFNQEQDAWQINVPRNSDCLFVAATLSYLIPVRGDPIGFQDRFDKLFVENTQLVINQDKFKNLKQFIQEYNPFLDKEIYADKILKELVQRFRKKVDKFIRDNHSKFKNKPSGNLDNCLSNMENSQRWGTDIEIEAISGLLGCKVKVFPNTDGISYGINEHREILQLFYDPSAAGGSKDGNYYSFSVEKNIGNEYRQLWEVDQRLKWFVESFVYMYETSLLEYFARLENKSTKSGKYATFVNELFEIGKGGTEAIEVAPIKAGSLVGIGVLQKILSSIGNYDNREQLKKLMQQLYWFKKDPNAVRKVLVKSGVDIFRSFESQFFQVTADESWERAMDKLAHDAIGRIFNYYKKNTEEEFSDLSITKGIVLGVSKAYTHTSTKFLHFTEGHTLNYKKSEEWNTAILFDEIGLVVLGSGSEENKYYDKESNGKSKKYGFRLLFEWEEKDKSISNHELTIEDRNYILSRVGGRDEYKYVLINKELKEKKEEEILHQINNQDPKLVERRLLNTFEEGIQKIRQDAWENANMLKEHIESNHEELSKYIQDHKNFIKNLFEEQSEKLEEIADKTVQIHKGINQLQGGQERIEEAVEAGREESRQRGEKIQSKIDKLPGEVIERIEPLIKKTLDKVPLVWFEVKKPVSLFTGRNKELLDLQNSFQKSQYVAISGLGGVGKSELAIKYAYINFDQQQDNLIWINAETHEVIKQSFYRLAKDDLKIPTKDADGENKNLISIVKDIYRSLSHRKSLFILDDAQDFASIEELISLLHSDKFYFLITSNSLAWAHDRVAIEVFTLPSFNRAESIEFVHKSFNINDDSQNKDIAKLVEELDNLPLALRQVLVYIKEEDRKIKNVNQDKSFGINDYIKECDGGNLLAHEALKKIDGSHDKTVFKSIQPSLDKIKNDPIFGNQALQVIHIVAYFSPNNIPVEVFKPLVNDNERQLGSIINLLKQYLIVTQENGLYAHGSVQKVIKLSLDSKNVEEKILAEALSLLKSHMLDANSIEKYLPHILSVWNDASKYDTLVEDFIAKDIGSSKNSYATNFHLIVEDSSYEVVEEILNSIKNKDIDRNKFNKKLNKVVNAKSRDGKTPLHYAARGGNEQIVNLLIQHKANINTRDKIDNRPLHLASKGGHLGVVELLLDNKTDVNAVTSFKYRFTPLHLAAKNGYAQVVDILLKRGAEIDSQTAYGLTALHFASEDGHLIVVKLLLDNKAEINAVTSFKYRFTPLHLAAKNGYAQVVDILLKRGAEIDSQTAYGFTALHYAILNNNIDVVNALVNNDQINVNLQTTEGNTASHLAAKKGYFTIFEALMLTKKVDLTIKNGEGKTVLDLFDDGNHERH